MFFAAVSLSAFVRGHRDSVDSKMQRDHLLIEVCDPFVSPAGIKARSTLAVTANISPQG